MGVSADKFSGSRDWGRRKVQSWGVTFPVLQALEGMAGVWLGEKEHLKEAVGVLQPGWQLQFQRFWE